MRHTPQTDDNGGDVVAQLHRDGPPTGGPTATYEAAPLFKIIGMITSDTPQRVARDHATEPGRGLMDHLSPTA